MKKLVLVLVVGTLAIAACGGSSSKSSDNTNSNSNSNSNSSSNSNNSGDFGKLLDFENGTKIRVTYNFGEGSGDNVTISRDGKGKLAYLKGNTQAIVDGDIVITCDNLDSTPECKQYSGNGAKAVLAGYTGFVTVAQRVVKIADKLPNSYGDTSTETIAGRSAICASITYKAVAGNGALGNIIGNATGISDNAGYTVCADKETGILLKWETVGFQGDQEQLIVATEVGEPKASDFEPPATPKSATVPSMPEITLPNGATIPSIPGINP